MVALTDEKRALLNQVTEFKESFDAAHIRKGV